MYQHGMSFENYEGKPPARPLPEYLGDSVSLDRYSFTNRHSERKCSKAMQSGKSVPYTQMGFESPSAVHHDYISPAPPAFRRDSDKVGSYCDSLTFSSTRRSKHQDLKEEEEKTYVQMQSFQDSSTYSQTTYIKATSSGAVYGTRDMSLMQQEQLHINAPSMIRTNSRTYDLNDPKTMEEQTAIMEQIKHRRASSAGANVSTSASMPPAEASSSETFATRPRSASMPAAAAQLDAGEGARSIHTTANVKNDDKLKKFTVYDKCSKFGTSTVRLPMFAGRTVRIHGTNALTEGIANHGIIKVQCLQCNEHSFVKNDSKPLFCTLCNSISPLELAATKAKESARICANLTPNTEAIVAKKLSEFRRNVDD